MADQVDSIGLAEALEALRAELVVAKTQAEDSEVHFPIETLTVELKVGVTRTTEGNVGLRVPLVGAELGGAVGNDRETVQTVTVVLGAPVDREGRPIKVASSAIQRKG